MKIGIIGSGSFALALSNILCENNHEVLLCIQTGKKMSDVDRMRFATDDFYIKSPEEVKEFFPNLPEALENTVKIAEKCNVEFEFGHTILPNYEVPAEFPTHYDYFKKL